MQKPEKSFLYLFLLLSFISQSQVYTSNSGGLNLFRINSNYRNAEIELQNGTIKKGLVSGFIENENIEFGNFSQLSNFEHQLNLDDSQFFFKSDENATPEKLTQNDVKRVSLQNGSRIKSYYLLEIFAVDKKTKNLANLKRKVWLPLLREKEKMNIFGFNLFVNNRYVYTYFYLSKDNTKAIRFFDDGLFLCGFDCSKEYFSNFLDKTFVSDCPNMEKPVRLFMENFTKENLKQSQKEKEIEQKKIKKDDNLSKQEQKDKLLELEENVVLNPIEKLITEYQTNCK